MKGFTHKRVTTEKINVKGKLSEDGTQITYIENDIETTVCVTEYFKKFGNMPVDFSLSIKDEEDLSYEAE